MTMKAFKQHLLEMKARFERDPHYRARSLAVCGSEATARAFHDPRGVTIARFAALCGLSLHTVRHWVELGLITPSEVGGKFYFQEFNLAQAESVRQWQDLGLSLEEIAQQRESRYRSFLVPEFTDADGRAHGSAMGVILEQADQSFRFAFVQGELDASDPRLAPFQKLYADYSAVLEDLKARRDELQQKIDLWSARLEAVRHPAP